MCAAAFLSRPGNDAIPLTPGSAYLPVSARTLQGVACARSGQALAWPLVSGRRGCSGSDAQGWVPKIISAKRFRNDLRVPLTVEGHPRTLSGPSPDRSSAWTSLQPAPSAWESVPYGSAASAPTCPVRAIDVAINTWYGGQVGYGRRSV